MSTPLRRFVPRAVATAPPPTTFEFGWNISSSLNIGGLIDVDMRDIVTARQTWTNGNGVSIDAGWYSLTDPVLDDYGVEPDVRLNGRLYSTSDARPSAEWQIFCPAGTYRVWVGTGLDIATNLSLQLIVKDATGAFAGTRHVTPLDFRFAISAEEWVAADGSRYTTAAQWTASYAADYYEVTIPDRSGTSADATGMTLELSKSTVTGSTWWWIQHMRVEKL